MEDLDSGGSAPLPADDSAQELVASISDETRQALHGFSGARDVAPVRSPISRSHSPATTEAFARVVEEWSSGWSRTSQVAHEAARDRTKLMAGSEEALRDAQTKQIKQATKDDHRKADDDHTQAEDEHKKAEQQRIARWIGMVASVVVLVVSTVFVGIIALQRGNLLQGDGLAPLIVAFFAMVGLIVPPLFGQQGK